METLGSIGYLVLVLGPLIFIHELGHFLVAKWMGVRVERFSLGFPPHIFTVQRGETKYSIGVIPLGGYVKMAGENPDDNVTGASDEFMSKPVGRRSLIIFAGPFMNYVLAIALVSSLLFFQGQPVTDPDRAMVGDIAADGPAMQAGLQTGDQMIAVNDVLVNSFLDLQSNVYPHVEEEVTLTWLRGADTMRASVITSRTPVMNEAGGLDTVGIIGISEMAVNYEPMGFFTSIGVGFESSNVFVARTLVFVKKIFSGEISFKNVGGPVFIAQQSGVEARKGVAEFMIFMALLSVNLAVLNVLPIPVLDGGHLVFLGLEAILRRPLSMKIRMIAMQVGMVALLVLIVSVTYNDILRALSN